MRRRRMLDPLSAFQDPGKDLFAYLFLVMLLFTIILISMKPAQQPVKGQPLGTEPLYGDSKNKISLGVVSRAGDELEVMFEDRRLTVADLNKREAITQVLEKDSIVHIRFDEGTSSSDVIEIVMALARSGVEYRVVEQ